MVWNLHLNTLNKCLRDMAVTNMAQVEIGHDDAFKKWHSITAQARKAEK